MKKTLESYLFTRHFLVAGTEDTYPDAFETVFSLSNLFGIRILKGHEMACRKMIHIAAEELGTDVPRSFYQNFPLSVRKLTPEQLLYDQFRHYFISYCLGAGKPEGHPLQEERFVRLAFRENVPVKDFEIISLQEAEEKLRQDVDALLASTRPLRQDQYQVVLAYIRSQNYLPNKCACKDTAIQLALDTGDLRFTDFITLADMIRMAEILLVRRNKEKEAILLYANISGYHIEGVTDLSGIQRLWKKVNILNDGTSIELRINGRKISDITNRKELEELFSQVKNSGAYNNCHACCYLLCRWTEDPDILKHECHKILNRGKDIRHLTLRRKEKNILARTLDRKLNVPGLDYTDCFEKRQAWHCMLGHIHYKPKTKTGEQFVKTIWKGPNQSVYARMEAAIKANHIPEAAEVIIKGKGYGAFVRNFRFLLSRCNTIEEIEGVFSQLKTKNLILLVQMLITYDEYEQSLDISREFRFVRRNRVCVHRETESERRRRKSYLPEGWIDDLPFLLRQILEKNCAGRLGKVFLSPDMVFVPLPLQEATGSGGYGTMPKGTVIPLDRRKIVRFFIYWKGVRDINISGRGITASGDPVEKFNWQTMFRLNGNAVRYSGDQTSGTNGGSEYMDVDMQQLRGMFPTMRYLVIEVNIYHYSYAPDTVTFQDCQLRTGYMMRDRAASGEIYEPKTVGTNIRVSGQSSHILLFAIDLKNSSLIWLNVQPESDESVPVYSHDFILRYLRMQKIMNLYDFFCLLSTELTGDPMEADVVVSDQSLTYKEGAEVIHSYDTARILELMNPQ